MLILKLNYVIEWLLIDNPYFCLQRLFLNSLEHIQKLNENIWKLEFFLEKYFEMLRNDWRIVDAAAEAFPAAYLYKGVLSEANKKLAIFDRKSIESMTISSTVPTASTFWPQELWKIVEVVKKQSTLLPWILVPNIQKQQQSRKLSCWNFENFLRTNSTELMKCECDC